MNANRLKAFLTVADKGSYTLAAEELFVSQSALSQQIKTLESELGAELFDHSVRRVVLTPAGNAFLPRARQMLQLEQDTMAELSFAGQKKSFYSVRVGCIYDQITQYWVDLYHLDPELEQKYKPIAERYPGRAELLQALRSGRIDICIQLENEMIQSYELEFIPLVTSREMCVSLYSNAVPDKESLCIEDLSPYWIAFHYPENYVIYEDELRRELTRRPGGARVINPSNFPDIQYGIPVLLMVPGVRLPKDKHRYARPLQWGEGIRVGFVIRRDCSPFVREYAETIRTIIAEKGSPWE